MNDYFAWPDSPRGRTSDADAIDAGGEQHAIAAVRSGSDMSTILPARLNVTRTPAAGRRHGTRGMQTGAAGARKTNPVRPLDSVVPLALPAGTARTQATTARTPKSWRHGSDSGSLAQKWGGRPCGRPPRQTPVFRLATGDVRDVRVPVTEQPSGLRLHRLGRCSGKHHRSSRQRTAIRRRPAVARRRRPIRQVAVVVDLLGRDPDRAVVLVGRSVVPHRGRGGGASPFGPGANGE